MISGYYWAKWNHSRMNERLVVFIANNGDCFVSGSELPYDQDSFIFLTGVLTEPCST